ncbi:MAG: endolytic transglycosylase MltG [Gammaproteobacteria bacterium]|nr:endolytic transglycosylase MltG [Gammaproteobacteria bacterium]
MRRIWRYLIGTVVLGFMALVLAGAGYVYWSGLQPVKSGSDSFVVSPGSGVKRIAERLVEEEVLSEPYTFTLWAYASDYTRRLHAGEYFIPSDATVDEVLKIIVSGKVIQRPITLIEGWTFAELRQALYGAEKLRIETRDLTRAGIMERLDAEQKNPEGWFFPDTYHYTADMSDLDILGRAHATMVRVLDEEWENRDQAVDLENRYEALVLASIIEKETGRSAERRTIAGVFHNRLRKGMRLQTDPTVIYGLGDDFDGNLTRAHLESDTAHNTYTRAGLPPTPIAMPGRASVHAALNPAETTALYFVSRGDGSHEFSDTLAEHNRAVAEYQINRRSRSESGEEDGADEPEN